MSGEFDDEYDDSVADDFFSLVGEAQLNELKAVEEQREREREANRLLEEKRKSSSMTLMQIAGMKSQKELDQIAAAKDDAEVKRVADEDRKRKEIENAKLRDQFPPPVITDS